MKHLITLVFIALLVEGSGQIPFTTLPDWESNPNGYVSTGLGLADINGDGFKDIIVANGNDISRQHLVVYYNNGDGTFLPDPSWESEDIDYHGHLACGDIDKDGDIDVAVSVYIGPTGFSSPGKVKVYYNQGTQLESTPSFVSNPFYTFSCDLGDADGDGDLDLAATAGEPYGGILDHGKIFLSDSGQFQPTPQWETSIPIGSLDVEFGDFNQEGFMDVIFVCENDPASIYLANNSALISTTPAWQSAEGPIYINSVDIGYKNGTTMVVMTGNDQLGGDGKVRMYSFQQEIPPLSTADWTSFHYGYGSGIMLADLQANDTLDLVYGGWWLPINVAKGKVNGFELTPSYTSGTSSVVEAIEMADLGKQSFELKAFTLIPDETNAGTHVILLPDQLVEEIVSIERNGISVGIEGYAWVPNKCWVSFKDPLVIDENIVIHYYYSPNPDMVVTNWDSSIGNYIFYNTNPPIGINNPKESDPSFISQPFPNPASDHLYIRNTDLTNESAVEIFNIYGGRILSKVYTGNMDVDVSGLVEGIYLVIIKNNGNIFSSKLLIER